MERELDNQVVWDIIVLTQGKEYREMRNRNYTHMAVVYKEGETSHLFSSPDQIISSQ